MKFKKSDYKICIVGLGYVGLPLAAIFSLKGFDVIGFDTSELQKGMGLQNIDSRIKSINGICKWKSVQNKGTRLIIKI